MQQQIMQQRMPPLAPNQTQMAAPPPPTWTCCQCKATNLTANATRCPMPRCAHDKCHKCREGPPSPRLGSPSPLFPSAQSLSISTYGPTSQYTYSTTTNDFSTPRPMQPSQPSTTPRQYPLGAYPPPPPGLRRETHNNPSGPYSPTSAYGYPSSSASRYLSNSGAAQVSNSRGMTGYGRSSLASPRTSGGRGRHGARPNMAGWWVCCHDEYENNPALCPDMCAMGDHQRCPRCRILGRDGYLVD